MTQLTEWLPVGPPNPVLSTSTEEKHTPLTAPLENGDRQHRVAMYISPLWNLPTAVAVTRSTAPGSCSRDYSGI